jgi:RNA polymerase-binding transcription factor
VTPLGVADREELRGRLTGERRRLYDLYRRDLREGRESRQEGTEDSLDVAEDAYEKEEHFAFSAVEREQLRLIDEALQRLADGTYGVCLHSGRPIPLPRLREMPWARHTAEVQEQVERGLLRGAV